MGICRNLVQVQLLFKKKSLLQGACREMGSSATAAEKREVHASRLLLRSALLCRATSALGHLHAPRVEKRRHD